MTRPKGKGRASVAKTFGARLRTERLNRGMTRKKLAERSTVSYRTICRLETTDQVPRDGVLLRLADALERPVGALREWSN